MKNRLLFSVMFLSLANCVGTIVDDRDAAVIDVATVQPPTEDAGAVCKLHACASDADCTDCAEGRTTCFETRCTACAAPTPTGCEDGLVCQSSGFCGTPSCLTDGGTPTVVCASNADCAGCDPAHLVCDIESATCVACTSSNESQCLATQFCSDEHACSYRCPAACATDADCAMCDGKQYCGSGGTCVAG